MRDRVALKANEETLNDDGKALYNNGVMLQGVRGRRTAFNYNKGEFQGWRRCKKGDERTLKCDVGAFKGNG